MGKYTGKLNTDVYGFQVPEIKPCILEYSKDEAGALDADGLLVEHDTSATLVTTASVFLAQPPSARQITAIVKAEDASEVTADATVLIKGLNVAGDAIEETLTFTANLATALTTNKAFKTVTSCVFSAQADGTPAFNVGWNKAIGLPFKLAEKPFVLEMFNNVIDFTVGSSVVDAIDVSKNVYTPHGTLDGNKALRLLLFV